MKILYTNKYVEIKAYKDKKYLDIKQKQKIQDVKTLDHLSQVIKYYSDVTKYDSMVFTINDVEVSFDYNLFQEQYFHDIKQVGMKNLLLIIHDDEKRNFYQHELLGFNENFGLHVELFKDKSTALEWITNQPREILSFH